MIDETDAQIIRILQKDGRTPNTEIAKELGLNEATVRKRLQKLISSRTIKIIAMGTGLGSGGLAGSMTVQADVKKLDSIINALRAFDEIWFMVQTIARHNLELEYYVDDMQHFNEFLTGVRKIEGVMNVETSMYTDLLIEKYDWSLPIHRGVSRHS